MFGRSKKTLLLVRRSFSILLLTVFIFSFSAWQKQNRAMAQAGVLSEENLLFARAAGGYRALETAFGLYQKWALEEIIECNWELFKEDIGLLEQLLGHIVDYSEALQEWGRNNPGAKERTDLRNESFSNLFDKATKAIDDLCRKFEEHCPPKEKPKEAEPADYSQIIKKPIKDGVTGKPLEGDTFVLPGDEDGTPKKVTDRYEPLAGDTVIISAPCHVKRKYWIDKEPFPDDLVLNPRPLRFAIRCEDWVALEKIRHGLAEQGITFDPKECVEMYPFAWGKGVGEGIYFCIVEINCYTREIKDGPDIDFITEKHCPDQVLPQPDAGSEPGDVGWFEPEVERDGLKRAKKAKAKGTRGPVNDPYYNATGTWGQCYGDQWGLKRIGFADDKKSLWPKGGTPVVVAVLDTGIDMYHPDLIAKTWINEDEIPGNRKDDDNNGYIDDVYGWNFVDNNNDITDLNGHGTIVSGIIGAWTNNNIGIAGVNPWAVIMPVKITDFDNKGWSLSLAKAIMYAADNGARVINLSVGGKRLTHAEQIAVNYALDKGVLVVTAAGNDGINTNDFSPAGLDGVITVACTDPDDKRVNFSNWGREVDIAAPGVDILSLRARGTDYLFYEREDYKSRLAIIGEDSKYYRTGGSSFSAPFVSGTASLILSKNPKLSGQDLRRMIVYSAEDIDVPGRDQYTGYGLLDARAALAADPEYFVEVQIDGLKMAKRGERTVFDVSGTVDADRLEAAWIEVGRGEDPDTWKAVSSKIKKPVTQGLLGNFDVAEVKGYKKWTVRLIAEHKNGRKQEARYLLTLK